MTALFRLAADEVHVWSLRLDLADADAGRLQETLMPAELARAGRFAAVADRRRFVTARGLLRVVLAGYIGARPRDVTLEIGSSGKPHLAGRSGPRFNLSHARTRGLLAVAADREVGIDIEELRELDDLEGLAKTSFSTAEREALAAVPTRHRQRAFFAGWTRKEAFLKALGEGLSRPLDSFDVTLAPGEPARLLQVQGMPGAPARYEIRALRASPNHVGALAIEGRDVTIRVRRWQLLSALLDETLADGYEVRQDEYRMEGDRER